MKTQKLSIEKIPAVIYGEKADAVYIFIHGMCGCKEEGEAFAKIACNYGCQVLAIDLPSHGERKNAQDEFYPWNAVPEIKKVYTYAQTKWNTVSVRANSIGAYFSMLALKDEVPEKCLFVSPVLDMKKLIGSMMKNAGVSEQRLEAEKVIPVPDGQPLSWKYYTFAAENPAKKCSNQTFVLYPELDMLTDRETAEKFCAENGCRMQFAEGCEHWFHTDEQLRILHEWEEKIISSGKEI